MAILASRTRTGISWIVESVALFKQSPRRWLLLALSYLGLFVLMPSMPGMQIFAFATILTWPVFIAIAMRLYRNVEVKKEESLQAVIQHVQPKAKTLILLGLVNLLYFILVSLILSADMQVLSNILARQHELDEQEMTAAVQTMIPILFKLMLLFIPLTVMSWFSPTLVAFNQYSFGKAIKSSIAGCLQYFVALIAAWLLLTAGMMTLMMAASVLAGFISMVIPNAAPLLVSVIVFGCVLIGIALILAFQYISYRDIFRSA